VKFLRSRRTPAPSELSKGASRSSPDAPDPSEATAHLSAKNANKLGAPALYSPLSARSRGWADIEEVAVVKTDADYIPSSKPSRIYVSKEFPSASDATRPMRFISRVFESGERDSLATVKGEIVLRTTTTGRQQVKALFYVDTARSNISCCRGSPSTRTSQV